VQKGPKHYLTIFLIFTFSVEICHVRGQKLRPLIAAIAYPDVYSTFKGTDFMNAGRDIVATRIFEKNDRCMVGTFVIVASSANI